METGSHTPNRYLQWVCESGAPPLRGSLAKAQEAAQQLAGEWIRAKRRMARGTPRWEHLDALEEAGQALGAVICLFECQAEVSRRISPAKAQAWLDHWQSWTERMNNTLTRGRVAAAVRVLQQQAHTPQRKRQTELFFEGSQCPGWIEKSLRHQEKRQADRDEAYVRQREKMGGVLLQGDVEGIHRSYLTAARKAAKERELEGRLFKPWTDEANGAACHADFSDLRRHIWHEENYAPVPMAAVEKMRRTRHAQAHACGVYSHADLRFLNHMVYANPRSLVKDIQQARLPLIQAHRSLLKAGQKLAAANGLRIDEDSLAPWNTHYILEQAGLRLNVDVPGVFPWRETCLKVFSEIMSQCGWSQASPAKISGQGEWSVVHFHIQRDATGQRTHLLYAPFRPRHKGHSYFAGVAIALINRWSSQGANTRDNTVWITQSLDIDSKHFSLDDLRVLCHELGHALHFSAMEGQTADELSHLPEDTTELPSYLLEMYHRDPSVLARWASKKGPAAAKRPRFWKRKLEWGAEAAVEHLDFLRSAQLDLMAHLECGRSYKELAEELLALEGQHLRKEDDTWKRLFIWDTDLACVDFTQSLPQSMVRRIITVPDHGMMNSQTAARAYRALLDEVMLGADTPAKAAAKWKRWAGESFSTSMKLALINHARQSARITRRGTQALRKKTATKNKRIND